MFLSLMYYLKKFNSRVFDCRYALNILISCVCFHIKNFIFMMDVLLL